MTLAPRLELRLQTRLALTPDLRLRLALLRMGAAELDEALAREAAENPFLRHQPRATPGGVLAPEALLAAPGPSLDEDLRAQLGLMGLEPGVRRLAERLIGELDDEGFLAPEVLDTLPRDTGPRALEALQSCEPTGIGARSVAECLALQLVDRGLTPDQAQATVAQLAAFARHDWAEAGRALGLDAQGVQARAALLRGLSPRPALPEHAPLALLRPDLRLVRDSHGGITLVPDARSRPRVVLDAAMQRRARTERFGAELMARAQAVVAALEQRESTLARIGNWLAIHQREFFQPGSRGGPRALVPARQVDLAAALDLHPSTISRALAGKAVEVDGRLWLLTAFFPAALAGAAGPVSARAVQQRIAEMIRAESADQPLSDDALAAKLHGEGVDIARRTVAKYRQGLRIPPSSTRRRLAVARQAARGGE